MLYHCPHRGITTDKLVQLCPECQGLVEAIGLNKAALAAIKEEDARIRVTVHYKDDWPDELPLDYRMDV